MRLAALAGAVLIGTASCGLPGPSEASSVPASDLPLPSPTSTPPPDPSPSGSAAGAARVALIKDGSCLTRGPAIPALPDDPKSAASMIVDTLVRGPDAVQRAQGLTSRVRNDQGLSVAAVQDHVARLVVGPAGEDTARARDELWVGQVVRSVTSVPSITAVHFVDQDGIDVQLPLPGGRLTTGRVTPAMVAGLCTR